ncbi:MAG: mechanosensitive ion channel family protein [Nitrospiria bacterium]
MDYTHLQHLAFSAAVFAGAAGAALAVRHLVLSVLRRWSAATATTVDDRVLLVIRGPSVYWALALGLYVAIGTSSLPARVIAVSFSVLHALLILSFALVTANAAVHLLRYTAQRSDLPVAGLTYVVIKGFIIALGFLILLGTLGVSITPLLTALGVGGLAVALALQDTLSNLFAGIHILMEKSIRVGQFIRLETGEEGYVTDIGWRTTRLRLLPNNVVIIPNNKLVQNRIINYDLPDKSMALLIPISVGYGADLDRVQRMLVEEATRGSADIPGLLAQPAPFVRFIPGFGPAALDLTLICQVREFTDQFLVQHELRLRILTRFRAEGIEIPCPPRTLYVQGSQPSMPAPGTEGA